MSTNNLIRKRSLQHTEVGTYSEEYTWRDSMSGVFGVVAANVGHCGL